MLNRNDDKEYNLMKDPLQDGLNKMHKDTKGLEVIIEDILRRNI